MSLDYRDRTIRLVASDLDGTFLNPQEKVTPRLKEAINRIIAADCGFVIATGRPPRWLAPVVDQLDYAPLCICANGAMVIDPNRDEITASHRLAPDAAAHIVEVATTLFHGRGTTGFAVERGGDVGQSPAVDSFFISPDYTHIWQPEGKAPGETVAPNIVGLDELTSQPVVKLLVRNVDFTSRDIFDALAAHIPAGTAHMTFSIPDGLVEIAAPGVTKRMGLEDVARQRGITRGSIIAFGDMPNDTEMLQWAGIGVAMGNADEKVKLIADIVCADNAHDGVAGILEEILGPTTGP
ncbi:HAD family hydrolase [Corynebacterium mendelii]|uniref:HAD family hydrolase n=1 Tax=Corynebacterium mendelii TaxID=2765362 RepID=A0A939E2G1_9CORY|nr:HAD family hydrolase [Corynebacterium mendelii]MBN9645281.1 HAD family hydrolase [Corynebacterium mendelii]